MLHPYLPNYNVQPSGQLTHRICHIACQYFARKQRNVKTSSLMKLVSRVCADSVSKRLRSKHSSPAKPSKHTYRYKPKHIAKPTKYRREYNAISSTECLSNMSTPAINKLHALHKNRLQIRETPTSVQAHQLRTPKQLYTHTKQLLHIQTQQLPHITRDAKQLLNLLLPMLHKVAQIFRNNHTTQPLLQRFPFQSLC